MSKIWKWFFHRPERLYINGELVKPVDKVVFTGDIHDLEGLVK